MPLLALPRGPRLPAACGRSAPSRSSRTRPARTGSPASCGIPSASSPSAGPATTGRRTATGWSRSATRSTRSSGGRATPGRRCACCSRGRWPSRTSGLSGHRLARPTSPPVTSSSRTASSRSASSWTTRTASRSSSRSPSSRPRRRLGWSVVLVLALDTATPTLVAGLARWSAPRRCRGAGRARRPLGHRHAELLTPAIREVTDRRRPDDRPTSARWSPGSGPARSPGCGWARHRRGARRRARTARRRRLLARRDRLGARTVVTDARRKESYWAAYAADGSGPTGRASSARRTLGRPVRSSATRPSPGGWSAGRGGRGDDGGAARAAARSWPTRRPPGRWCRCTCAVPTPRRRRPSRRCPRHDRAPATDDRRRPARRDGAGGGALRPRHLDGGDVPRRALPGRHPALRGGRVPPRRRRTRGSEPGDP